MVSVASARFATLKKRATVDTCLSPTFLPVIVLTSGRGADGPGPLDHLAFAVADNTALVAWADHLAAVGIEHHGIVLEDGRPSLALRDPDGTAIELVAPAPRPGSN